MALVATHWCIVPSAHSMMLRRFRASVIFGVAPFLMASNLLVTIGAAKAERLLYLPTLGFSLALSTALGTVLDCLSARPGEKRRRKTRVPTVSWRVLRGMSSMGALGVAVLLLVAYSIRTLQRNQHWMSGETLWREAYRSAPRSLIVLNNIAVRRSSQGNWTGAVEALQPVLDMDLPHTWGLPTIHALRNLALSLEATEESEAGNSLAEQLHVRVRSLLRQFCSAAPRPGWCF